MLISNYINTKCTNILVVNRPPQSTNPQFLQMKQNTETQVYIRAIPERLSSNSEYYITNIAKNVSALLLHLYTNIGQQKYLSISSVFEINKSISCKMQTYTSN